MAHAAAATADAAADVHLDSNVGVVSRDGIRLATDVYRPARNGRPLDGRFPVILERTPYGRATTSFRDIRAANRTARSRAEVAGDYVRRGYVLVYQDCRGRGDSGGEFEKYVHEGIRNTVHCDADRASCVRLPLLSRLGVPTWPPK